MYALSRTIGLLVLLFLATTLAAEGPSGLRVIESQSDGSGGSPTADDSTSPDSGTTDDTTSPDPGDPGTAALASRVDGVAPLAVHFSAGAAASTESSRPFHDFEYEWNFGDSGAGNWETTGKSKNTALGPVAAHVFENPGTYSVDLTVRGAGGVVDTDRVTITVEDPDVVYDGSTTCVSDTTRDDFTGCPAGSRLVTTDDLSEVTGYATAGSRVLFHRGSSWTLTNGLSWPSNSGPVTIGAYGSGPKPLITLEDQPFLGLSNKQDWRFMDIAFQDSRRTYDITNGTNDMQRILIFRIDSDGGNDPIGWTHYNSSDAIPISQMAVVECNIADFEEYAFYVGAERLALLGNVGADSRNTHVTRIWQGYLTVVSHNIFSGTSLDSGTGRQALKFHGPSEDLIRDTPAPSTRTLRRRSQFAVISNNVFGQSGPWPVSMGPQDSGSDERLSDFMISRNRFVSEYGTYTQPIQISLRVAGRYFSIQNNVFDASGPGNGYTGIDVHQEGVEPAPAHVRVRNNTVYRGTDARNGAFGIHVGTEASDTVVVNNIVSFPDVSTSFTGAVDDDGTRTVLENNLFVDEPGLSNPDGGDPLLRDFDLDASSPAIDSGSDVPVFSDFDGGRRPVGAYDAGAFEYGN